MDGELRQAITQVQQGKGEVRESLIAQYLPFILKVTSRSCKRFVRLGEDDEVNVGLLAFNEALDKFDDTKNASFLTFAEGVIKRRMIDYFRKMGASKKEIPWSCLSDSQEEQEQAFALEKLTWERAQNSYHESEINNARREEIKEFQQELSVFGISFRDLVLASPKHKDARMTAYQVARLIFENTQYRQHLFRNKSLPLKDLELQVKVSRKTLERQRKYIIALTIIMVGQFYYLEEYLEGLGGGST